MTTWYVDMGFHNGLEQTGGLNLKLILKLIVLLVG